MRAANGVLCAAGTAFLLSISAMAANAMPNCLFVLSYHKGYGWSDGVEAGLRSKLRDRCERRHQSRWDDAFCETWHRENSQDTVRAGETP